jgi:transcriptional regulator with XRE-family HTH domain
MEAKDFIGALVQRGWTQSQIAERTGIPQPTLSKVLRGDVEDVLSRNYRKLQALYDEVLALESAPSLPAQAEGTEHAEAAECPGSRDAADPGVWPLQRENRLLPRREGPTAERER